MIGTRLKQLRTDAGLDGPTFAAIAGTTKQYVGQLESGTNKSPNALFLLKWARHFGVRIEWLIDGEPPRAAASHSVGPAYDTIATAIRLLEAVATARRRKAPNITPAQLFVAMEIVRADESSTTGSHPPADFVAQFLTRLAEVELEHDDVGRED